MRTCGDCKHFEAPKANDPIGACKMQKTLTMIVTRSSPIGRCRKFRPTLQACLRDVFAKGKEGKK